MRWHLFSLMALLPAATNVAAYSGREVMVVALCTGDGVARSVTVPMGEQKLPGSDQATCCAKGCHGSSRKRPLREFDPTQ